jgi:hypothetical protein
MKLRTIILAFNGVTQVYDSIQEFQRKWELKDAYKELRDAMEIFEKNKEQTIAELKLDNGAIPNALVPEANLRLNKIAEQDIKLKYNLKFTKKEVEKSNIKGSELTNILDFIKD